MTVASEVSNIEHAGDGVTVAFSIPFNFLSNSDIEVSRRDSAGDSTVLSTGYAITGAGTGSGTCTFTTAPAASTVVRIERKPQIHQPMDLVSNDSFPAETVETAHDRQTYIAQYIRALIERCIQAPAGDASIGAMELAAASTRASTILGFDSAGNLDYLTSIGVTVLSQAVIGGFLYPRTAAEISAGVTPTNYAYPEGHAFRYLSSAAKTDVEAFSFGVDVTASLQTAMDIAWASGSPCILPRGGYSVTTLDLPGESALRDRSFRMWGSGIGEIFDRTMGGATILKSTTNAPILRYIPDAANTGNGSADIGWIRFEGDSSTAYVVDFDSFYAQSIMHDCCIFQNGNGGGLNCELSNTGSFERIYCLNADWNTFSLGAARTGIGFNITNSIDTGLTLMSKTTSRGFLTGYNFGGGAGAHYSNVLDDFECSVVRNGVVIASNCTKMVIRKGYMEGGDGGTAILDEGNYTDVDGNLIFSGFAVGIDSTAATRGNCYENNVLSAGSVANTVLLDIDDGGFGKVVRDNAFTFSGSGGAIAGVVGIRIAGAAPYLDLSGNSFNPSGAWTGGAGTMKVDDNSTSGGCFGFFQTEEPTVGQPFPLLSRGVVSLAEGFAALADAAVTSNTLSFAGAAYYVVTMTGAQTITALAGPGVPDCREVTFRTTNANASFTDAANLQLAGGTTFTGPGIIRFLIDSGVAYELHRMVL